MPSTIKIPFQMEIENTTQPSPPTAMHSGFRFDDEEEQFLRLEDE
jgi:hypothetical protein